ncbi:hypothetical protein LepocDRAFT_00003650 [Leptothrix ochracea L12]|uniref:Uncharacterized protein n=1 Tax=Leptothrix ochracea L12 TaxID=735332 RepID=I4Z5Y9_9BURK|nr:hypothetical protein LepocDRAFT_00003640 [Leptothrix ochracea L12]EIM31632.1 hypothetical protein LepocDRAFT_00003650 [Leptothrix ochracea L12]
MRSWSGLCLDPRHASHVVRPEPSSLYTFSTLKLSLARRCRLHHQDEFTDFDSIHAVTFADGCPIFSGGDRSIH